MSGRAGSSGPISSKSSILRNISFDLLGKGGATLFLLVVAVETSSSSITGEADWSSRCVCAVNLVNRLPSSLNSGTTDTVGEAERCRLGLPAGGGPANGSLSVVETSPDALRAWSDTSDALPCREIPFELLCRDMAADERGVFVCPKALASQLRLPALSSDALRDPGEVGGSGKEYIESGPVSVRFWLGTAESDTWCNNFGGSCSVSPLASSTAIPGKGESFEL